MPRHQERAVRLPLQRQIENGQIHQAVQCIELALDGAAAPGVDDGPAGRVDDVACRNHVASPEEHDRVAVGVRGRLMNDLNAFAVQVHRVLMVIERLRRPEPGCHGRLPAGRSRHAPQHVFMRQHAGPAEVRDHVVVQAGAGHDSARENAEPGPGELLVPASVIGVHAGVDDVADREVRQTTNRRQHLVRSLGRS